MSIDRFFDVMNSRLKHDGKTLRYGNGVHSIDQQKALEDMESIAINSRVGSRKTLLPFQRGILMSIRALRGLCSVSKMNLPSGTCSLADYIRIVWRVFSADLWGQRLPALPIGSRCYIQHMEASDRWHQWKD